jgi:DNA-binding NarL/FixJ family response regulator
MNIRVMIVEQHPKIRRDLRIFLHSCAGLEVAGEASSTTEAVILCGRIQPDVILVSLTGLERSAIAGIRLLRHEYPASRTVVISSIDDIMLKAQAMVAGAAHVITGNPSRDLLIDAIHYAAETARQ